jgi:acetoin utilization deacetylase AcuC-like enzyme
MTTTGIIFTPKFYAHKTGFGHPEKPTRLKAIIHELGKLDADLIEGKLKRYTPDTAKIEDLELVHTREHIQLVKHVCKQGGGLLDLGDTVVSPSSFKVALLAAGGVKKAVDLVLSSKVKNAFALIRPPGHHAGSYFAMGFCLFNNVAIAAAHLTKNLGFKRVFIIDVDAHHGNGTQEIFYNSDRVLYISLHEDPQQFPGSGFIDETGEDEGKGYNVNVPFPFEVGDKEYLRAFDEIVIPIAKQYNPQFVLASVGYDGYFKDPVAKLNLSISCYNSIFEKILDLTSTHCDDRFVAILEGGYNIRNLGKLAVSTISKMADFSYLVKNVSKNDPINLKVEKRAKEIIEKVKETQSVFWSL